MNLPGVDIPWLVWVFLFIFFGPYALASKLGAKFPGALGWVGRWWQGRDPNVQDDRRESESYRIQGEEIARLTTQYERLRRDWAEQNARLDEFGQDLQKANRQITIVNQRFYAAIGYVRDLVIDFRRVDPTHRPPNPPELLKEYL